MPIVYVHGVAVRDENEELAKALARFKDVPWPSIEAFAREHVAPVISDDPDGVPIMRAYWGDLGADFAFGGRSLVSAAAQLPADPVAVSADSLADAAAAPNPTAGPTPMPPTPRPPRRSVASALRDVQVRSVNQAVTALRKPVETWLPTFIGDVMTYLGGRGNAVAPGPIPHRVVEVLETAQFAAESRGEPLVVLTHSMGGQIVYDLVTHFIPLTPQWRHIRVDYWCATASQVGLFEELKLFLASDPSCNLQTGRLAPFPPREHLGGWWNVWDHADVLSFRAAGVIEGVDDTPFFAAGSLATDHNRYLDNLEFWSMFAARVRAHLARAGAGGPA